MSKHKPRKVNCRACGQPLKPVVPDSPIEYQFDNALWIGFFGGYGMFVYQNMDDEPRTLSGSSGQDVIASHEVVICHDCAHELCDRVPWIKKLLEPETSHSH